MAAKYLELGADLCICGRRREPLEKTAAELTAKYGGSVKCHTVDIRDAAAVDAMAPAIWEDGGPRTGLVHNPGGNLLPRPRDPSPRRVAATAHPRLDGTAQRSPPVRRPGD